MGVVKDKDTAVPRQMRMQDTTVRCSIILPPVREATEYERYLRRLHPARIPDNYEVIGLNRLPGRGMIWAGRPRLKLLDTGRPFAPEQFFDEAAAASGAFLLFVRRPVVFDMAVLEESIEEIENCDPPLSVSVNQSFILVHRDYFAAVGTFAALLKTVGLPSIPSPAESGGRSAITDPAVERLEFGSEALKMLLTRCHFNTVLDIGCGDGRHTEMFRKYGKRVTAIDLKPGIADAIIGDYNATDFEPHDCVWCCHVLEHQLNVNAFLRKINRQLRPGGVLAVTVTPLKHRIVGGHVSHWNAGLVMYNLVLAGFDCSQIALKKYGYNISAVLKKRRITLPADLNYDNGDLEKLSRYFPPFVHQAFDGDIEQYNWGWAETG